MSGKAGDADTGVIINFNSWLFGLGAVCAIATMLLNGAFNTVGSTILAGNYTVFHAVSFLSVFLMLLGFVYSTGILKPDMRRRHNERKLMALKINAARHDDHIDKTTGLANKQFLLRVTDDYLKSLQKQKRGVGIVAVHVAAPTDIHIETLKIVSNILLKNARDYDVVARVGFDTIAVTLASVDAADLAKIATRISTAIVASPEMPMLAEHTIGFAISDREESSADHVLADAETNLKEALELGIPGLAA